MSEPARDTDPLQGRIPGFQIEQEVARGGMATVYLANQLSLDRKVALKILREFDDPEQRVRFFNESRIIGSLNHRNVITIYDVGIDDDCVFLAMEYLAGGDLATRIEKGPIDRCEALEIAAAIGDCLVSVHGQGVVHRDVKPANVLFHGDGTPILTDFGIATDVKIDTRLTALGATLGSPLYLSPEQASGQPTDGRTDIYSLGVVLYEMLTGWPPFLEKTAVETMAARLSTPVPRLDDHLTSCQSVLDKMLAREPGDRFSSAQDMVDAVRDLQITLSGEDTRQPAVHSVVESVQAMIVSARQRAVGWLPNRLPGGRAALVGIAVLTLGVYGFEWLAEPSEVTENLRQADAAVEDDRLFQPRSNNAVFYFRKALRFDPGNDDAEDGLHDIAELFADRAETDLVDRQFSSAKYHLDRGLKAEPHNPRLLKLQEDTRSLRSIPEKVVRGLKSIFE
jgi:serine/threonine protein kinase